MMNGRIVKGVHFQNMVDAGDPAECIARYCEEGADEIWMLDIKASEEGRRTNLEMIRRAAALCTVPLCIGGGIKNLDDVDAVMEAGARKVGIGSAALTNDEVIRRASYKYGPGAVTALVDVFRNAAGEYEVMGAGQKPSGKLLAPWIRQLADWGAGEILLTTMQDGAKTGYDLEATRIAAEASPLPVIASGGAGELVHFADAVKKAGARGVLAASVFHSGKFSIAQVKQYLEGEGIPVLRPGEIDLGAVRFDEKGLVPAIAQDAASGTVLMLAYMNRESLEQTLRTRLATYFSRSRQELWVKGATSGHYQHVREVRYDCDGDAICSRSTRSARPATPGTIPASSTRCSPCPAAAARPWARRSSRPSTTRCSTARRIPRRVPTPTSSWKRAWTRSARRSSRRRRRCSSPPRTAASRRSASRLRT